MKSPLQERAEQAALDTNPPAAPFTLFQGVVVARPAAYWKYLRLDISHGPSGPRARLGTLRADLKRLRALFGG